MGETQVDLLHLLEDLRDAYPESIEETFVTERSPTPSTPARCSLATALRDITDLLDRGILARNPGGSRSTSYQLAEHG